MRTWPIRLLAVALVGSAGAFNLQAHAAARAIEAATGLALSSVHQVVLHGVACAAYILALVVFPSPSWDGLPGARPARGGLAVVAIVTFLLVGVGTALLPHTTSCVLFFGFLVPAVGLVVLPRRIRRGPGADARTQARLLFSALVGLSAVAVVLGIVTVLLDVLGEAPGLTLVDPTAHGAASMDPAVHGTVSTAPTALLFWFARLASAAIAVVVLVSTRRDRLWTAERWFSRGLAVLLVMAVAGGVFVVLRTVVQRMARRDGTGRPWRPCWSRWPSDRCTSAPRGSSTGCSTGRDRRRTACSPTSPRCPGRRYRRRGRPRPRRTWPGSAEAVALGLGASVCRLTVRRPGLRDRTYEWTDRSAAGFAVATWSRCPSDTERAGRRAGGRPPGDVGAAGPALPPAHRHR